MAIELSADDFTERIHPPRLEFPEGARYQRCRNKNLTGCGKLHCGGIML